MGRSFGPLDDQQWYSWVGESKKADHKTTCPRGGPAHQRSIIKEHAGEHDHGGMGPKRGYEGRNRDIPSGQHVHYSSGSKESWLGRAWAAYVRLQLVDIAYENVPGVR